VQTNENKFELVAPSYLRHIIVIMTEMGLRPYKDLLPMLKSQVDLENRVAHISESRTGNRIGEMPTAELALKAFREQVEESAGSEYLFHRLTARGTKPFLGNVPPNGVTAHGVWHLSFLPKAR
jgi:hypothetical protein